MIKHDLYPRTLFRFSEKSLIPNQPFEVGGRPLMGSPPANRYTYSPLWHPPPPATSAMKPQAPM